MLKTGSSSPVSILHKIVANCSCLYHLVASGSFGSCLHREVVTSCPFLLGSSLFPEVVLFVVFVLIVSLLVPNAFFTVVRLVVCLVVVVMINTICADVNWIIWLSAETVWIRNKKTHSWMASYLISKAHIFSHSDHRRHMLCGFGSSRWSAPSHRKCKSLCYFASLLSHRFSAKWRTILLFLQSF